MRKILPVIVLFFFACKKEGDQKTLASIFYDSSFTKYYGGYYRLDINADKIPDLKFGWYGFTDPAGITNWGEETSYIVALHNQVSIHATQQSVTVCKDTSSPDGWLYTEIYNCTGGPKYLRTDTFVATPNLDSLSLMSTSFNKMSDSVIIYRRKYHWESYSYDESVKHGFFLNASSGFLLFKLGQKRYALRLKQRDNYLPLIENLVQIDP